MSTISRRPTAGLRLLVLVAVLLGGPGRLGAAGAADPCDPALLGNTDSEVAYQLRGDRCEGIYKLEVGGIQLRLESLTESFESFDAADPRDLEVAWSLPPGREQGSVRLQANALLPRTFYRMDAAVPAAGGSFVWPCDLLARQGYGREDLGIFGWLEPAAGEKRIYLPLRVRQHQEPRRRGLYELAFTPRSRLEEVYVSVYPASEDGRRHGAAIWEDLALEYGQYLAGSPVFVDLPQLPASGYYRVEISVSLYDGASGSDHFVLYHQEAAP